MSLLRGAAELGDYERLLTDAIVTGFDIRRERHTVAACHLRVRLSLVDGSR